MGQERITYSNRAARACEDRSWVRLRAHTLPLIYPPCKVLRTESATHTNTIDFRIGKGTQWDDKVWKEEQKCIQLRTGSCLGCPIFEMAREKTQNLPPNEAQTVARQIEREFCMWDTRMQIDKLDINKRRNKW